MHPTTWKTSGHDDAFSDPLIDNRDSKKRYRADVLVEDQMAKWQDKIDKEVEKAAKRFGDTFDKDKFMPTNAGLLEYNEALNRFKDYNLSDPTKSNTMYNILVNGNKLLGANVLRGIYEFPISGNGTDYSYHPISKRTDPILQIEYLNKEYLWALYQEDFKLEIISRKNLA